MPLRVPEVREAFTSVTRALKAVVLYRHARDQHDAHLAPAVAALQALLSSAPEVTLSVDPGGLSFAGEVVHTEPARDGNLCFRLYRDGIRTLTFCRGIDLAELLQMIDVAIPTDPAARREDAVTQLWKAGLKCIRWTAASGYRLEGDSAGSEQIAEAAGRAQEVLDDAVAGSEGAPARLMTEEERKSFDPEDWGELSCSIADIVARIVERGFAGRDVAALAECFGRLCAEMVGRGEHAALIQALRRAANLTGNDAIPFRLALGQFLADAALLQGCLKLAARVGRPAADLPPLWLESMSAEAGPLALAVMPHHPSASAALAAAAMARVRHCRAEIESALEHGPPDVARALLGAARNLPSKMRASLAACALGHASRHVPLTAVPLVTADPARAIEKLGPMLRNPDAALRIASADALSQIEDAAPAAADLLIGAISRAEFARLYLDEQKVFYRSLGRLRTPRALEFLAGRLTGAKERWSPRSRPDADVLLAVRGLAEDGSPRALALLDEGTALAGPAGAACRAAAAMARGKRNAA